MKEEIVRLLREGYTVRQVQDELRRQKVYPVPEEQEILVVYNELRQCQTS